MIFKKAFNKYANMSVESAFSVLGLPFEASSDEVRAAFRALVRENHPDLHPERAEKMAMINAAHDIVQEHLRNPRPSSTFKSTSSPSGSYENWQEKRRKIQKIEKYFYENLFENGLLQDLWESGELESYLKKQNAVNLFKPFMKKEFPKMNFVQKHLEDLYSKVAAKFPNFTLLLFMGKKEPDERAEMTMRYLLYLKKERTDFDAMEKYFNVTLLPQ